MSIKIYRIDDLIDELKMSKSTIRRLMAQGDFPKPIRLGDRIDVWRETSIENWLASKEGSVGDSNSNPSNQVGQKT